MGLTFSQIGLITLVYQVTASILQPIIGFYADKRPTPNALPGGTLFSLAGLLVLSIAHSLWLAAGRRVAARHGVIGVSPRIVASRADGGGRPSWPGAIAVSGRRQCGAGAGAAGGGGGRGALGARDSGRFRHAGAAVLRDFVECRAMVQAPWAGPADTRQIRCANRGRAAAGARDAGHHRAVVHDLFEICLHGQPDELFHILPDPPVRGFGRSGAVAFVCVSAGRSRSARWWADRSATGSDANT